MLYKIGLALAAALAVSAEETTCTVGERIVEYELGTKTAHGYSVFDCVEETIKSTSSMRSAKMYTLADGSALPHGTKTGDVVTLTLERVADREEEVYNVKKLHSHKSVSTRDQYNDQVTYEGLRSIRILGLILELDDETVDYLGDTPSSRIDNSYNELQYMSETYLQSSWGKMDVNFEKTKVITTKLNKEVIDYKPAMCNGLIYSRAVQNAQMDMYDEAAAQGIDFNDYDTILYYLPESFQFPRNAYCGLGGWAYLGVVPINLNSADPPFTPDRSSFYWKHGIFIRMFFNEGTGTVTGHELGHQLGFGHAGGTGSNDKDDEDAWMENLANYGDSSAVMGNDADVRNSFTAMVRFKLGWLPNSEIQQDLSAPIRLAALTLGPKDAVAGESDIYLAASTPCSNCVTKILNSDGTPKSYDRGGYLWITFRGDGDECSPESSYCHVDHNQYYNQVFVHWQQPGSLTTERWYYMSPGESYQPPGSGLTVSVCAIEGDVAKVAITPATCNSAAELKTLIAKARKVLKKAHASGSLQAR